MQISVNFGLITSDLQLETKASAYISRFELGSFIAELLI